MALSIILCLSKGWDLLSEKKIFMLNSWRRISLVKIFFFLRAFDSFEELFLLECQYFIVL